MSRDVASGPLRSRTAWVLAWAVLLPVVAGTACVLFNPYLWFDEAGQFFLALGMDHWSAPFTPPQDLHAVLQENNRYLFDPVGYTLLVRLWATAGTSAVWLRTLPFVGFLGMLGTAYALLRKADVPRPAALLLTALLPSSPLLHHYAGELRPYSFEAWGALFAAWVVYDVQTGFASTRRAALLGCGMAAFLWMRYPAVLATAVAGGLVVASGVRRRQFRSRAWWLGLSAYALPQIVSAGLIYALNIRHQPITTQAPCYAQASTLKYHPGHLLHPWTATYCACVLLFFGVLLWAARKAPKTFYAYRPWAGYTALLLAVWAAFSAAGKLPSDPSARWAISLNAVAMVSLVLTVAVGLKRAAPRWQGLLVLLLAVGALYRPVLQTVRWANADPVRFPGKGFQTEVRAFAEQTRMPVGCSSGATPEVRYLFEWGSLRPFARQCRYPQNFILLNQQNEWAFLNRLPLYQRVTWVDSPGKFVRDGRFQTARLTPFHHFYSLWRVR